MPARMTSVGLRRVLAHSRIVLTNEEIACDFG
jgi:hypothetical protein